MNLVARTAAIGAQARSAADAKGSAKPVLQVVIEAGPPPQTSRHRWTVHRWGGEVVEVVVYEAQTQREMRELYPAAGGVIAVEA